MQSCNPATHCALIASTDFGCATIQRCALVLEPHATFTSYTTRLAQFRCLRATHRSYSYTLTAAIPQNKRRQDPKSPFAPKNEQKGREGSKSGLCLG